jgi:acetyltransferase-like isoleucine patch superfamily enzyme
LRAALRVIQRAAYRRLALGANVTVGARFHAGPGTRLWAPSSLTVGDDVYIGKWCTIEVDGRIGAGTLIANNVGIVGRRDHDIHQTGVRMSRARWVGNPDNQDLRTEAIIGRDVWIGFGAILLAPVTIGDGAVVAAGTVVTSDVEAYQVVGGNPLRALGSRRGARDQESGS